MKQRIRHLTLSVRATVVLLLTAATLIVVGIFNETLKWDIFGPRVEAILYGVFFSSIALACIGVALTLVLGIQDIVRSFQALEKASSGTCNEMLEASKSVYVKYLLCSLGLLFGIIVVLASANYVVQGHRVKVFKNIAADQMKQFNSRFTQIVSSLPEPPRNNVPLDLYELIKSLDNLSYIQKTTLYLMDTGDNAAMWGYSPRGEYKKEEGFTRFFVAKDFEKAIAEAINGEETFLRKINDRREFTWYFIVKNKSGKGIAVVRLNGNPRENFRDYVLGS